MNVLMQEWLIDGTHKLSISKDEAQVRATLEDVKAKGSHKPEGGAYDVALDEKHPLFEHLAERIKECTIFLEGEEERAVIY